MISDQALLRVDQVVKRFGGVTAIDHLSLDIRSGEFFALLGPSGCGKTTLLRTLAGFEAPDEGRILLDGADISGVLPHQRPLNMMFQSYALFPHLSVHDNIAFGLRRASLPRAEIRARVAEMLSLVQLEGLGRRKPDQLSGGQRQRVALARALARRPRVLLLDEPLAALDKKLREDTQRELKALQRRLGTTFIIVTHDQEEAMMLADRIGVMDRGQLVQVAPPRELYEAPRSRWVAEFVGAMNVFEGEVTAREGHRWTVATADAGPLAVTSPPQSGDGARIAVGIRPEKVRLSHRAPAAGAALNIVEGTVSDLGYRGGATVYQVLLDTGATVRAALANIARLESDALRVGERVVVWFAPDDCVVLEA